MKLPTLFAALAVGILLLAIYVMAKGAHRCGCVADSYGARAPMHQAAAPASVAEQEVPAMEATAATGTEDASVTGGAGVVGTESAPGTSGMAMTAPGFEGDSNEAALSQMSGDGAYAQIVKARRVPYVGQHSASRPNPLLSGAGTGIRKNKWMKGDDGLPGLGIGFYLASKDDVASTEYTAIMDT